ncbi:MAG: hypothetical protein KDI22_04260 [Gammaproteobacteria bacterium]|nr:hypothetical protein [Gammaproteobacteria bacterium]MCP5317808.1 hypothetical protein [Chromatiaceae bacterium]MCP5434720.1 hypothetical protein [Chromatiaceae bacterium]
MTSETYKSSLVSLAFMCALAPVQAGGIKCWTDQHGDTACGDTVPPQAVQRGYRELNERGIEVNRYERALTPEEIEREKARKQLIAEQQQLIEEQKRRDSLLLNLYRNEDDLVMARDGKIRDLDQQIQLKHDEIRRLKTRLSDLQAAAAATERSGKQLSTQQKANLDITQRSIETSYAIILGKEDEKRDTIERYNYDLERFRQLRKGNPRAANADVIRQSEIPDLVETAVRCNDEAECARLWDIAQQYARTHATTSIDLAAERILVTAPPRNIRDVSITVSRLTDFTQGGERIFMDVQCAGFTEAREYCRGPEVTAIREQFRIALQK